MPADAGTIIQIVESSGGSLSIISCLYMGYRIRNEGVANTANRMLSFLFVVDFILGIAYVIGRAAIPIHGLCQFQALIIQWFSIVAILWAVLMAYQMRQWIVAKKHPKRIESTMRSYKIVIVGASFVLAIILLGTGVYGDAYLWCWVKPNYAEVRFVLFDLILFGAWGVIAVFLWEVSVSINMRLKRSSLNVRVLEMLAGQTSMQRRLMLYVSIFVVVWFFAILNRLLEWGTGDSIFATALIQALMLSLQGFWHALAFTDALGLWSYIGIHNSNTDNFVLNRDIKATAELREVMLEAPTTGPTARRQTAAGHAHSPPSSPTKKYKPKQYSIFTTTLNMGEASLASLLPDLPLWILKGHDVYAVGVQECLDINGVSEAILQHLGGSAQYSMYRTAIGSGNTTLGYHGYIALMLYVRVADLRAGTIIPTMPSASTMATGADLIVTTAQNKGAVGLPLQIHDTNICFVTCHLPSDSKGASKLTKRNASAHAILRGLALAPEDVGFDLHLQHDHVMVFGDMNYRMDSAASGGGMGSLSGVAVACLIEKSAMADDTQWHTRRYNLMRNPTDPLFPKVEEIKLLKAARAASRGAWSSVLRADELRSIMADGDAFSGFEEPMPCFPPSYKRKKGTVEGDCGDYTDPLQIIHGFTNTGEVQELDVSRLSEAEVVQETQKIAAKKLRPASYTDRVLVHSLPDRQDRLTVQSYDFCDQLRISDHRAVSMTVRLEVNSAVFFQNHAPVVTGARAEAPPDPAKEPRFQLYELSITELSVALDPGFSTTSGKRGADDDADDDSDDSDDDSVDARESKSRSEDEGDVGLHTHYVGFSKDGGKAGKGGSEEPAVVATTTNPLLSNPAADSALRKAGRTRSGRGVAFADDAKAESTSGSGLGVAIEMSSTVSSASSPSPVNSPEASPVASPVASPAPSASPAARPSPSRPGMLVRAKSANAAALNSPSSTTSSSSGLIDNNNSSSSNAESSSTAAGGAGADTEGGGAQSPARKPRFLSRLSMAITGSKGAALTEAAQAADRQRTDAVMSRSLIKNRNRSIFGVFLGSGKASSESPQDESGAIIDELSRDSLAWEGDARETGQWKKRLQEEAERRAHGKKRSAKLVSKMKKGKKLQKNSKKIAQVLVVFPLPVKDPLLSHRKLYDFAQAFNIGGQGDVESNLSHTESSGKRNITREELLRPLSVFPWIEESRPGSGRRNTSSAAGAGGEGGSERESDAGPAGASGSGKSDSGGGGGGSSSKLASKAANLLRVTGCASPELGAHVLLKFLNPSGYELGSAVVSLTHLLHTSTEEVHATHYPSITIASGGQQRGTIGGKFSLKFLPSLVSGEKK